MKTLRIIFTINFLLLFTVLIPRMAQGQSVPERVEPPFWWADMYHTELQVMVYGKNVGLTRVQVSEPGVTIREVVAVENPNYLFVYLDLSQAKPGVVRMNFYAGNNLQFVYDYELRAREEGSMYRRGFDASDAIYLLMPDRFSNGDPGNDEISGMLEGADRRNPDARQGGDIQGIIDHLDYIADMGFTALWINPLLENNQPRYSYHGYATTDYYKIDPRFGTNEDYRRLVHLAEGKGIKVIKDMIFNHCGHYHWWMKDLPSADWLNQWPEFTRTSYRMTTMVDPYVSFADEKRMADGWFDNNMPDLNQRNRQLATYLIQNSVWWIEYADLKGIRKDTQPYSDKYFMAEWGRYVMDEYPYFNIVGESWMGIPAMISYFQGGKNNHDGYDSNIPSVFDFSLYDEIGLAFEEGNGWATGLMRLYNSLAMDFLYPNPYNLVIFGDNHDTDRFFSRVGGDLRNQKMALTFLMTTRGIPMIYSGTELLESAFEHDGHGKMRTTFPGGFPGDVVNAFTRQGRSDEQNEIFDHLVRLLQFRNENPVLHFGWLKHFVPEDNVYVYFRYDGDQRIMVVMNNNEQAIDVDLARYREGWDGASEAVEVLSGKRHATFDRWHVPAKTAEVFELF
ncbi:MAG: glycoside hydrolase family 13 protein [Bacteroidales bacterium]|jgi:glycosidase|nr:glycoside hydrolase family 13 protein [Bacteroidales bacterium]NLM93726.1 glycoside hydrolase family 13 protein [Bacteroidales bacterium]